MKRASKPIVTMLAVVALAALLAGCSAQPQQQQQSESAASAESAASEEPKEQTQEELLSELEALVAGKDYKSVTIQMAGGSNIGSDAVSPSEGSESAKAEQGSATAQSEDEGLDDESLEDGQDAASGESAAGDDESETADEEDGAVEEGDEEDADASTTSEEDEADSDDASVDSADKDQQDVSGGDEELNVLAKCDLSGKTAKTQATVTSLGRTVELFINGDNAIMVIDGQVKEDTVEKLGMTQYADIQSIIRSQAADISTFKDAVENIEVTRDDAKSVYKVTCNPETFATDNATTTAFSKYDRTMKLESAEVVYTFDSANRLMAIEMNVFGPEFNAQYTSKLTSYDTTKVADKPNYDELGEGDGSGDDEYAEYDEYDEDYADYEETDESESDSDADSESDSEAEAKPRTVAKSPNNPLGIRRDRNPDFRLKKGGILAIA